MAGAGALTAMSAAEAESALTTSAELASRTFIIFFVPGKSSNAAGEGRYSRVFNPQQQIESSTPFSELRCK